MQTEQLIEEAVERFGKESATYYLDLPTIHFFKQFLVRELSTIASKSAETAKEEGAREESQRMREWAEKEYFRVKRAETDDTYQDVLETIVYVGIK